MPTLHRVFAAVEAVVLLAYAVITLVFSDAAATTIFETIPANAVPFVSIMLKVLS